MTIRMLKQVNYCSCQLEYVNHN